MVETLCLAFAIWFECRGCDNRIDQIAVGNVVMNRVGDTTGEFREYNSACSVINQEGHWPWTGLEPKFQNEIDRKEWNRILELASEVKDGYHGDVTDGAKWFHGSHVSYTWTRNLERVSVGSGVHTFWRKTQ